MISDVNFNGIFEFIKILNFAPAEHRARRVYAKQNVAFEKGPFNWHEGMGQGGRFLIS